MAKIIKSQRTAVETYQRCPRRWWLGYGIKFDGMKIGGFEADKPAFALEIGSGFHEGMRYVLGAVMMHYAAVPESMRPAERPDLFMPTQETIDEAVQIAVARYDKYILPYFAVHEKINEAFRNDPHVGAEAQDDPDQYEDVFDFYSVNEGRAITEALVRVYCAAPAGLAMLLEEYEVLEVEQELEAPLDPEGRVVLMSRPDGILRSRSDGQLYVLSFKTANKMDSRKEAAGQDDMEGISQLWAAEHKYGEAFGGVQLIRVLKGYNKKDKDGRWKIHNGIARPYAKLGLSGADDQLGFAYDYINADGEPKKRVQSQGWQTVNLWEWGKTAIKDWVEQLRVGNDNDCNPDLLDTMVLMPETYVRDEEAMRDWAEMTYLQEVRINAAADYLNNADEKTAAFNPHYRGELLAHFPMHRHSCNYPTKCPFKSICHERMEIDGNPGFKVRRANHPSEEKQ